MSCALSGEKNGAPVAPSAALDVIFENSDVLVMNKPPNIPMDGDVAVYGCTVESMVHEHMKAHGIFDYAHEQLQQEGRRRRQLKFVHQLDYSTSGVLCVAFAKDMAARLAHCFEMRTTRKYYVALLHGHVPSDVAPAGDESTRVAPANHPSSPPPPPSERRCTPMREWVAACDAAWAGLGSVRVGGVSAAGAGEGHGVCDFSTLLQRRSAVAGEDGAAAVHRHCNTRRTPAAVSRPSPLEDPVEDAIYRVLEGPPSSSHAVVVVDLPVGYDVTDPQRFRMAVTAEQSRSATTDLLVLQRTYLVAAAAAPVDAAAEAEPPLPPRTPVTLVLLAPHTGRRHQLRVHCRAIGFPIVGDTSYCAALPWCPSGLPVPSPATWAADVVVDAPRMYLHAWRLLLPGNVAHSVSEVERVALKKKRRRETLGLSERGDASVSASRAEWTEFVAAVHFPGVAWEATV
ncbi:RNA pseudouridylate synthase [Novymonas esmeraldas]|uniref:RNA pseudouridylate synthase n=1 Tax=Novymonas esmeraldas TaxID=1808958 RepID=A0AAW0EJF6_9TRYP